MPVLGACNQPPNLIVISQYMAFGSLYDVLHGETGENSNINKNIIFKMCTRNCVTVQTRAMHTDINGTSEMRVN